MQWWFDKFEKYRREKESHNTSFHDWHWQCKYKNLNSILGASLQKSIMLRVLQQVKKLRVNNRYSTLHPSMHRKLLKDYIASLQAYTTLFLSFVNPDVSTYINYINYLSKPHHPDTRCSMHTLLNLWKFYRYCFTLFSWQSYWLLQLIGFLWENTNALFHIFRPLYLKAYRVTA